MQQEDVFGGGYNPPHKFVNFYVTIASTGNSQDFGNLSMGKGRYGSSCSSFNPWNIFYGESTSPTPGIQNIDYVTIAS